MSETQKSIHAFFGSKPSRDQSPGNKSQQNVVSNKSGSTTRKGGDAVDDDVPAQTACLSRIQRQGAQEPYQADDTGDLEDSEEDTPIVQLARKSTKLEDSANKVDTRHGKEDATGHAETMAPEHEQVSNEAKSSINSVLGKRKAAAATKVDGVGAGSVAAAAQHAGFDMDAVVSMARWDAGKPVPYAFLAATFNEIAPQSKRLAIVATLTSAMRCVIALTPSDLLPMVYLCTSKVAPAHSGIELGIGDAILIKALAQATGRQESQVKKEYATVGDLGEVACNSKGKQRTMFPTKPLTIVGVFEQLKSIASLEGHKSQDAKKNIIMKLLAAARDAEPGFLVRSIQGKLRIGLAEQSVLVALAQAITLERKTEHEPCAGNNLANTLETAAAAVRKAYSECPNYEKLIPALLQHGTDALLQHVHFEPGTPVKAMLARPTNGVSEVLDKFADSEFTCEYKYDGERAQVHVLEDGSVHIYSRNLENTTSKYPDVVARMRQALAPGVRSIVLDCEAQAWDSERKVFLPFQVLTTRKRKDVKEEDVKVQVVLYCFDCLYLDGDVLLRKPLRERREAMYRSIIPQDGQVQFATAKTSRDIDELQNFLDEAVKECTEGLIVKTLDDSYEPSKRSLNWLKLKKDYLEGQGDTFDVAVIGALHGKGKRTGGYGSFLLAVYDAEAEEFQSISKIGTGFSEELLKELSDQLKTHIIPQAPRYYRVTDKLIPDVWLDAKVVWEVKAADLSISPVYTAAIGKVDCAKGVSIRFPRLVRVRDDKGPEETTSPEQVADMYKRQAVVNSSSKVQVEDDFW
eukprot:jgi/Ulvmu1/5437/UM222_0001.1